MKDFPANCDVTKNVVVRGLSFAIDSVGAPDPSLEPLLVTTKLETQTDIPSPDSEDIHSKGKLL